jgi:HEAT repeat protein
MPRRDAQPRSLAAAFAAGALALSFASAAFAASPVPAKAPENKDEHAVDQLTRIEQVMWSRDVKAVEFLRKWAAIDENERVRERAIGALVLLGDKAEGQLYADRLARDTSAKVRRAAAEAIGMLKIPVPSTLLANTLQTDPDPVVRAESARAIGLTNQTLSGPVLLGAIAQDASPEVRALSAEAYGRLRLKQGAELLQGAALRETSAFVRLNVLRALIAVAPAESEQTFKTVWETAREPDLRIEALRGLLASGRGNWDLEGMASTDPQVRFLALKEWLGKHYPKRTVFHPKRTSSEVTRLEPFLQDTVRGIRDMARENLERAGYTLKSSGFGYQIVD